MNTTILPALFGSMLAMAPIVDSTFKFNSELKRPALSETSLVAHEWGTFTALQGSDGTVQNGMQHEEEHLPDFVHSRDPLSESNSVGLGRCNGFCKGFEPGTIFRDAQDADHLVVTQKMETPVLYFYSKNEVKEVKVSIGFPEGIISQYYPAPASFSPPLNHVANLAGGRVDFSFDIAMEDQVLEIPPVDEESVYAPSRNVNSNYVHTSGDENEKLIFYRGLGNFSTEIKITSDQSGIEIRNDSKTLTSRGGFLYYTDGDFIGGYLKVPSLLPGGALNLTNQEVEEFKYQMSPPFLIPQASAVLVANLEAEGLYHDEAVAMAKTWEKSYFRTPGLRYLYILPRSETESILPLTMTPQPTELVRALVGRIEIMTYQEEQKLISQIVKDGQNLNLENLGRLAEAKLRRVQQLVPAGFATDIQALIVKAAGQ